MRIKQAMVEKFWLLSVFKQFVVLCPLPSALGHKEEADLILVKCAMPSDGSEQGSCGLDI